MIKHFLARTAWRIAIDKLPKVNYRADMQEVQSNRDSPRGDSDPRILGRDCSQTHRCFTGRAAATTRIVVDGSS
jgi:hypothetical protein